MSNSRFHGPAFLFLVTLIAISIAACGPREPRGPGMGRGGPGGGQGQKKMQDFVARVTAELELNEWQQTRLRGVLAEAQRDAMNDYREYRDDSDKLEEATEARRKKAVSQIEVMLTPEQTAKWAAFKPELYRLLSERPQMGDRRGPPRGGGPGGPGGGGGGMPGGGMGGF